MGAVNIQVKILEGVAPVLFTWWNTANSCVDSCLVTCQCQGYHLGDNIQIFSTALGRPLSQVEKLTRALDASELVSIHDKKVGVHYLLEEFKKHLKKKKKKKKDRKSKRDKREREGSESDVGSSDQDTKNQTVEGADLTADVSSADGASEQQNCRSSASFSGASCRSDVPPVSRAGSVALSGHDYSASKDAVSESVSSPIIGQSSPNPKEDQAMFDTIQDAIRTLQEGELESRCDDDDGDKENSTSLPENSQRNSEDQNSGSTDHPADNGDESKVERKKYRKRIDKTILCELCGKLLMDRSVKRHMEVLHSGKERERPYQCEICHVRVLTRQSLNRHMLGHTNPQQFKCRFCEKSYKQDYGRKAHEELVHLPPATDLSVAKQRRKAYLYQMKDKVQCKICGRMLRKVSLKGHMDAHDERKFTCEYCGKTFKYSNKFTHMRKHTHPKSHSCPHCPAAFHSKESLDTHLQRHNKGKRISCRYCERTFANHGSRTSHERLHTGERPYHCDLCEKNWRNRSSYAQHMRTHHPGRPLMRPRNTDSKQPALDIHEFASAIGAITKEITERIGSEDDDDETVWLPDLEEPEVDTI